MPDMSATLGTVNQILGMLFAIAGAWVMAPKGAAAVRQRIGALGRWVRDRIGKREPAVRHVILGDAAAALDVLVFAAGSVSTGGPPPTVQQQIDNIRGQLADIRAEHKNDRAEDTARREEIRARTDELRADLDALEDQIERAALDDARGDSRGIWVVVAGIILLTPFMTDHPAGWLAVVTLVCVAAAGYALFLAIRDMPPKIADASG